MGWQLTFVNPSTSASVCTPHKLSIFLQNSAYTLKKLTTLWRKMKSPHQLELYLPKLRLRSLSLQDQSLLMRQQLSMSVPSSQIWQFLELHKVLYCREQWLIVTFPLICRLRFHRRDCFSHSSSNRVQHLQHFSTSPCVQSYWWHCKWGRWKVLCDSWGWIWHTRWCCLFQDSSWWYQLSRTIRSCTDWDQGQRWWVCMTIIYITSMTYTFIVRNDIHWICWEESDSIREWSSIRRWWVLYNSENQLCRVWEKRLSRQNSSDLTNQYNCRRNQHPVWPIIWCPLWIETQYWWSHYIWPECTNRRIQYKCISFRSSGLYSRGPRVLHFED